MALANGGGGIIVYGIDEAPLPDGGTAANALCSLPDGSLYERLNSLLDDRGEPRLSFDLHAVDSARGGLYLILDVAGRRRPHRANDGRYYGRRGTSSRAMTEAEVADAYRERFIRDQRSLEPAAGHTETGGELPEDVGARVHRGLRTSELALWRDDTGEEDPPGWMSVVVYPSLRQEDVLDPIRDRDRFDRIEIPDQWDPDQAPMQYFRLQPSVHGLFAQLPPGDDRPPAYLVRLHRDGLMEYGTTLEPALRHENPVDNRVIFTASHPQQAHDYLQAFAVALDALGYEGPVRAQVSLHHTRGVNLGIGQEYVAPLRHPIEEETVAGRLWELTAPPELIRRAGGIVKQVMDLVFVAGGIETGFWFIDDAGRWTGGNAA